MLLLYVPIGVKISSASVTATLSELHILYNGNVILIVFNLTTLLMDSPRFLSRSKLNTWDKKDSEVKLRHAKNVKNVYISL